MSATPNALRALARDLREGGPIEFELSRELLLEAAQELEDANFLLRRYHQYHKKVVEKTRERLAANTQHSQSGDRDEKQPQA